jgi:hypothetical protein
MLQVMKNLIMIQSKRHGVFARAVQNGWHFTFPAQAAARSFPHVRTGLCVYIEIYCTHV